jgi:hypothetical protein
MQDIPTVDGTKTISSNQIYAYAQRQNYIELGWCTSTRVYENFSSNSLF